MSLNHLAQAMARELVHHGATYHPVDSWGWFNLVLSGPFARAHLERLVRKKIDIIHCVVMPHTNDPSPIFGFDVIALNGQLTGMFMDLTPTVQGAQWPYVPKIEGESRPLPDWANFFSDDFVSCIPTVNDVWTGLALLRTYLGMLQPDADGDEHIIAGAQQTYTERQRANPKTQRMLASIVGQKKTDQFIRTVLWPDVTTEGADHG